MFKVCSACCATIERKDCHKNRYEEYICRKCQAAGIKFTTGGQRHYVMTRSGTAILRHLAIACMVLLGISIGLLTFQSFTSGGSEPDVFFDKRAGVSLNASAKARLNESQVQTASPTKNEKP